MKMKKKIFKIAIVMIILLLIGVFMSSSSFGWNMNLNEFEKANAGRAGNKVTNIMGALINIVSTVGAGVAIIMLIVLGIKYTGGPESKADAKKDLAGYIIGAVILFGVSGLLKLLQMFVDSNINK